MEYKSKIYFYAPRDNNHSLEFIVLQIQTQIHGIPLNILSQLFSKYVDNEHKLKSIATKIIRLINCEDKLVVIFKQMILLIMKLYVLRLRNIYWCLQV